MPGKKISRLGSNLHTNNTCVFGSMAGLNSTTGVRSWITGMNGYKYSRTAANGVNWQTGAPLNTNELNAGCGLHTPYGQNGLTRCTNGRSCLIFLGFDSSKSYNQYDPVRSKLLS